MIICRWLLLVVRKGALKSDGTGRCGETFLQDPEKGAVFKAVEDGCCSLIRFSRFCTEKAFGFRGTAQSALPTAWTCFVPFIASLLPFTIG